MCSAASLCRWVFRAGLSVTAAGTAAELRGCTVGSSLAQGAAHPTDPQLTGRAQCLGGKSGGKPWWWFDFGH